MFTWHHLGGQVTAMRDASMNDMTRFWIGRMVEATDWGPDDEVFLALIQHASLSYIENHLQSPDRREAFAKLERELLGVLTCLPKSPEDPPEPVPFKSWMIPTGVYVSEHAPEGFKERYAYYWSTNEWKRDFVSALETQFWVYRDYAHGAGKGKMTFLRELAEVWIAAATTALVRYADDNERTWRSVARMLRHHADMVEVDGLRALPWGAWGHKPKKPVSKDAGKGTTKRQPKSNG
jgi:hypothetical protein